MKPALQITVDTLKGRVDRLQFFALDQRGLVLRDWATDLRWQWFWFWHKRIRRRNDSQIEVILENKFLEESN